MLCQLSLTPGHYTHAFIDEAGQATEPESVIAIGLVAGANGQVCQLYSFVSYVRGYRIFLNAFINENIKFPIC